MASVSVDTGILEHVLTKVKVDRKKIFIFHHEKDQPNTTIFLDRLPREFLEELLVNLRKNDESEEECSLIEGYLIPREEIMKKEVSNLHNIVGCLMRLVGRGDILCRKSGVIKHPIKIDAADLRSFMTDNYLSLQTSFAYGEEQVNKWESLDAGTLIKNGKCTLAEALANAGFEFNSDESYREHVAKVAECQAFQKNKAGKQFIVEGPIYVPSPWNKEPMEFSIGTRRPLRAVVEDQLELISPLWYNNSEMETEIVPLVRIFLFEYKMYCYAHIDNLKEYKYNTNSFDQVVLPEETRNLLQGIFLKKHENVFTDLFGGRNGGVVVLADGPPGVGKTLTAETIADASQRPLYVADVGEIGINLVTVEHKLKTIFDRAAKWNAMLLLDEADIFLVKRSIDNIERNAIVGTFLKFLDGFDGNLFLTTNRANAIDPAFASRITARIQYPALDGAARKKIWIRMIDAAKLKIGESGIPEKKERVLQYLAELPINGRQIRNLVRLSCMMFGDQPFIEIEDFEKLLKFKLNVDETWDDASTAARRKDETKS